MWNVASLVSVPLQEERPFKITREVNEWMKTGDIREFSRDTKLEDEMTGAAFLAFVTNLRVFLSKKGIPLDQVLVVNLASNFDGVRMFYAYNLNQFEPTQQIPEKPVMRSLRLHQLHLKQKAKVREKDSIGATGMTFFMSFPFFYLVP